MMCCVRADVQSALVARQYPSAHDHVRLSLNEAGSDVLVCCLLFCFCFFKSRSHSVALAGLELPHIPDWLET